MKNINKNQKGITIVALAITVIILLILAGTTIHIFVSENMVETTESSREKYEIADDEEQISIIKRDLEINNMGVTEIGKIKSKLIANNFEIVHDIGEGEYDGQKVENNQIVVKCPHGTHTYIVSGEKVDSNNIDVDIDIMSKIFEIKYDGNNNTDGDTKKQTKYEFLEVELRENGFSKTGYTFNGWNTSKDGTGTSYKEGDSYNIDENITLYAEWEANKYTITFNTNGGICDTTSKTVTYESTYGELPIPTKEGYTFLGWYTSKTNGEKIESTTKVSIITNQTLYAGWEANTYTIVYDGNGATSGSTANSSHTYDVEKALTANGYAKTGYTFNGWNTKVDGTGTTYADKQEVKNLATSGSVTLYADWKANEDTKYTVIHQQEELDGTYKTVETENLKGTTDTKVKPGVKTYEGFTSPAVQEITIKADGTASVTYKYARNEYTVTLNKGNYIAEVTGAGKYKYGASVKVEAKLTTDAAGYKNSFVNWTGTSTSTENPYTYEMPAGNVTLTANGTTTPNTYTIIYDGNGATSGSTSNSSHTYDVEKALTANGYAKTGYTFNGWNTSKDGTGTAYADKQAVKNLATSGSLTLYAQWKDTIAPSKPVIKLNLNNSTGEIYTGQNYTNQNVFHTVTTTEQGTGIKKYQYSHNNKDWIDLPNWTTTYSSDKTTVTYIINWGGSWEFYVRAIDNSDNISEVSDKFTVKIDKTAPTLNITANLSANPTNASSITYTFTFSEDVTGFTADDITVTNGTKGAFSGSGKTYTLVVTNSGTCAQKVEVPVNKCVDRANNGNTSASKEVTIDRTAPTLNITANPSANPTNASSITYTFTFSEDVTGFTADDITVTNGTKGAFSGSGTTYTLVVTNSGNCTQKVEVVANKCVDRANNGNTLASKEITIDRTAPTLNITAKPSANPTNASSITYTFTFSEEVTGFTSDDITVTNGTKGAFSGSGKTYTLVVTNSETSAQKVEVPANKCVDTANNGNIASSKTVTIDKTGPQVTFGTNGNSTASKTASTKVTVTDVGGSTVNTTSLKYLWTTRNSGIAKADFTGNKSGTFTNAGTLTIPSNCSGEYYLYIYSEDALGNSSIVRSNKFTVGNITPDATVTQSVANETWTKDNVTLTIKPYSPTVLYDNGYVLTTNRDWSVGDLSWTKDYFETRDYSNMTFNINAKVHTIEAADTTKTTGIGLFYKYNNNGTTTNTWPAAGRLTTSAATSNWVDIGGKLTVPSTYVSTIRPWIQIDVSFNATGYKVEYKDIQYELYDPEKIKSVTVNGTNVTLTNGVGTYTVTQNGTYEIVITDIYGNIKTITKTISNIEKTAPTIEITPNSSTVTKTKDVTIKVADQGGSGLSTSNSYQYYLSTSASAQEGGSWVNYTSGTAFTIGSGLNGTYYLHVKEVKDTAGNTSGAKVSGAFIFDNAGPTGTSMEIKNVTTTGYDVYVYGVKDNISGVNRVQFPTWTTSNGQDDIQSNWTTNSVATGIKQSDGTTWVYRVNITDHKNENGQYNTHVYMYDNLGNSRMLTGKTVEVPAVKVTYDANYYTNNLWTNTNSITGSYSTAPTSNTLVNDTSVHNGQYVKMVMASGTVGGPYYMLGTKLTAGTTYTWSVYVKASSNKTLNMGQEQGGTKIVNITTSWQKFTYTYTATDASNKAFIFYLSGGSTWTAGDELYVHSLEIMEGTPTHTVENKQYSAALGTLSTPTRTGYTFTGWYTAPTGGTKITTSTTVPANDVTYYAHWTANINTKYTVIHQQEQLDGTYKTIETENLTGTTGHIITPAVKTYEGFTSPSKQTMIIKADGTASVTYKYPRKEYTVTVSKDANIKTVTGEGKYKYGATVSVEVTEYNTITGYTVSFENWTGTSTSTSNPYTFTMPASDVTLTANSKVAANTYTVKFDANGGTCSTASKTVTYNSTYGELPIPTRDGYNFIGWYTAITSGTEVLSTTKVTITSTQTLYAVWEVANIAPVFTSNTVSARNTNYITIKSTATDQDGDNLTYKLYLRTSSGSYSSTPNATSSATASGTAVTLKATGLSTYTIYKYKVEVTDGIAIVASTEGTTGTGCSGTGLTCSKGVLTPKTCGRFTRSTTVSRCPAGCYSSAYEYGTMTCKTCGTKKSISWCSCSCATCTNYGTSIHTTPSFEHTVNYYVCSTHNHTSSSSTHSYCSHGKTSLHYPN